MTTLTITDALDLIDTVVDAEGADHFSRSVYVDSARRPHCIVGRVLFMAGVSTWELLSYRASPIDTVFKEGLCSLDLTLGAVAVLRAAQRAQDWNESWGEARNQAIRAAEKLMDLIPDSVFAGALTPELATV